MVVRLDVPVSDGMCDQIDVSTRDELWNFIRELK